jgi:triacylglycerol lipase
VKRKKSSLLGLLLIAALTNAASAAKPDVEVLRNRTYIERDSGPLKMDIYLPEGRGPFPGVLVVHGGAWVTGSRAQLAAAAMALAQNGYTAAAISYRLAPHNPFPAQIYDCQAAVRWLRAHAGEFKLDPSRMGGFGYSAGGHLVALLGTLDDDDFREEGVSKDAPSARLQVVMAGGAPCEFRTLPARSQILAFWLGGTRAAKPDNYRNASPTNFITADDPPMLFFHGEYDALVPIASPQRMVRLLASAGVTSEMYAVKHSGHIQTLFDRPALEHALAFADRYLKADNGASKTGGGDAPAHPDAIVQQRAGPSSAPVSPELATRANNSPRGGSSSDGQ